MPIKELSMSILILSPANLRVLKNILMIDYEVSSSHASELIGALCGFNRYAALQSAMAGFDFPPAVEIDTALFEDRHVQLGYDQSSGEWMYFSFAGLPLPDRPWFIHSSSETHLRDHRFSYCEQLSMPYVTIHKKRRYCHFQWDCISIDSQYDKHVSGDDSGELSHQLFRLYQLAARGEEPKSYFSGKAFVGEITKVSEPIAQQLANEFFMLLYPWRLHQ
jgi:hypothetical protein